MNLPDNYKSLTKIATQHNQRLGNWMDKPVGKNAIAEFTLNYPDIENPVIVIKGRAANKGTWAHEKLAVKFLQWCNPDTVQGLLHQNIELKSEIQFQRTKIQAMLPFIPDSAIQKQIESGQSNRAIDLLRGDIDPGQKVEWLANWVARHPKTEEIAKRIVDSPGNEKPGTVYGEKYGYKSPQYKTAFKRWDEFECLLASLHPNADISVSNVIKWLDRIDRYSVADAYSPQGDVYNIKDLNRVE